MMHRGLQADANSSGRYLTYPFLIFSLCYGVYVHYYPMFQIRKLSLGGGGDKEWRGIPRGRAMNENKVLCMRKAGGIPWLHTCLLTFLLLRWNTVTKVAYISIYGAYVFGGCGWGAERVVRSRKLRAHFSTSSQASSSQSPPPGHTCSARPYLLSFSQPAPPAGNQLECLNTWT